MLLLNVRFASLTGRFVGYKWTSAMGRQRSFRFWTADIQLLNLSYRQQRPVNVSKEGGAAGEGTIF